MFEYIEKKRDPAAVIFYSCIIPFAVFWVVRRSLPAAFALQAYVITTIVFVIYPFEMKSKNLKHWSFWKRLLQVGVPADWVLLVGLWYLDSTYPVLVTGIVMLMFVAFVVGVFEMVVVGEVIDHFWPEHDAGAKSSNGVP